MKTALAIIALVTLSITIAYSLVETPEVSETYSVKACVGDKMQARGLSGIASSGYQVLASECR